MYCLQDEFFELSLYADKGGSIRIAGGRFAELTLAETPLFYGVLENVHTHEEKAFSSEDFSEVVVEETENELVCICRVPMGVSGIEITARAKQESGGISWSMDVNNTSVEYSVLEVSYPMPTVRGNKFDLFEPGACGKVIKNAGEKGFTYSGLYPQHEMCMSYFAVYESQGGIYLAIEDGKGAVKRISIQAGEYQACVRADYFAINAGKPGNSFSLSGVSRWRSFYGDWYDATMLYADFVYHHAEWLPSISQDGRTDTPLRFKDNPFWVVDYIPNSPSQGKNSPQTLAIGSDSCAKDYWYTGVIRLQKELGVPIAYHLYNWHCIPFNVEYPHFLPVKGDVQTGLEELKTHDITVMPYINAVSWETTDGDMGHRVNFENTGRYGAAIDRSGEVITTEYPQITVSGEKTKLAPMCPHFVPWRSIVKETARQIEANGGFEGLYFDEISAHRACPCYSTEHGHLPGGGSHWVEGYNQMMAEIREEKPADFFYTSECNAETYMRSFDGYLTWVWGQNGEVPAFPAIYSGYIQLFGRFCLGNKRENFEFFKYSTAKALLYGQQIGWYKADVVDRPKWLDYLKKIVAIRYAYRELFRNARMLRPPMVSCNLSPKITGPSLWLDNENIVMEQVMAGAWTHRNGGKIVLFLVNIAEEEADFVLEFSSEEYGLNPAVLPEGFREKSGVCRVEGTLGPLECRIWEFEEVRPC